MTTPRILPSIDDLRQRPALSALEAEYGSSAVLTAVRAITDELRQELRGPTPPAGDREDAAKTVERRAAQHLELAFAPSLVSVINATGVIVHTNLGRAPLAASAAQRVAELAAGYTNLEYDLGEGQRGSRSVHAERLLTQVTGAPAAAVVNNNAAAVLLVLAALASGREAIVSRGELVEIGGGFRIPDVMRQSGTDVREVGTTNKTRTADYAAAISDRTAVILRVHPSNFRIEGFTERPALDELVALGRRFAIPVVEDLGSGNLLHAQAMAGIGEPLVSASVTAGAAVCCFSGDKLLGGPQAGIIVGDKALVARIRSHPLMRALRVDKMTYAALEATLLEYARGRADATVPVARMLHATVEVIAQRATALADSLAGHPVFESDVIAGVSTVGGGGAPGSQIPTRLVRLSAQGRSASWLRRRLRQRRPPVITRIEGDRVLIDLRTVSPEQDDQLLELLRTLT
jgi:L-seryl-tRNA(Ser) seleniumtransferase